MNATGKYSLIIYLKGMLEMQQKDKVNRIFFAKVFPRSLLELPNTSQEYQFKFVCLGFNAAPQL